MPPVGFEPIISVGERPQTYDLDRVATGTGSYYLPNVQNYLPFLSWSTDASKHFSSTRS